MPVYQDKKTGRLYIEFQYKSIRHKERLPEGVTRAQGKELEVRIKANLMFESHGQDQSKSVTFEDFISSTFGPYCEKRYSKDSYDKAVHICKEALPYLKGRTMRSIKAADIDRFKQSRIHLKTKHGGSRRPATVERELSVISKIFTLAVKNDVIDYNPCSRVDKLKIRNVQEKVLEREDEDRFFANMHSQWARDVCRMVLNTGLRNSDLMNLTRFQVKDGYIRLTQSKTGNDVEIPINDVVREIIDRRAKTSGSKLFASPFAKSKNPSVRHAMNRACIRIGIEPLSIRDLRRTFATRKLEDGVDIVTLSRLLGHSDTRMLIRYARSARLMREAVEDTRLRRVK